MVTNVWEAYMPPFPIWGNLYFVGTKLASSHLIDTGDGLILLDSGYAETLYLVMDGIRELGFSPYDIRCIVHSHGHIDHVAGTRSLAARTGAATFLGRRDLDYVTGKRDLSFARELGMTFTETFTPDVLLDDGDTVSLGGAVIQCVHTPGHTEGTMSFFFQVTDGARTLRAGMHGGVGMNSMTAGFLRAHGLPDSLRDDFRAGLARLRREHVDILIGNHPEQCGTRGKYNRIQAGEPDAFVDPTAWPLFLRDCEERLDAMLVSERNISFKETKP